MTEEIGYAEVGCVKRRREKSPPGQEQVDIYLEGWRGHERIVEGIEIDQDERSTP